MFCHLYCFAAATQGKFFQSQKSNIYVIKKSAIESGIRIRRFFGRIAIPGYNCPIDFKLVVSEPFGYNLESVATL